jgi:hypothetical protein
MADITKVVDNSHMWDRFRDVIVKAKDRVALGRTDLRFAMASVLMAIMYRNAQRPGAALNCIVDEYRAATMVKVLTLLLIECKYTLFLQVGEHHVIAVRNHKTGIQGTAKLTLDQTLMDRLTQYYKYIRPLLVEPGKDIPYLFLRPGSKKVDKWGNLLLFLERELEITIPTPTTVRKIACTSSAKHSTQPENRLIARQMCHNPVVGANYYEAIHGRQTAVKAFTLLEGLRSKEMEDGGDDCDKPRQKRVRWTKEETALVHNKFAMDIDSDVTPQLADCKNVVEGKSPKQVQDKVRGLAKKKK